MPEPTFDTHGYPTDETLATIREWPATPLSGLVTLFGYMQKAWKYPARFAIRQNRTVECWTGGWSGNESLIAALLENTVVRALCYESWRRGGHYEFRIPGGE